jgi:hypothetical protein
MLAGAACAASLLALNAWIVARLFVTDYTLWMGSVEGAYIGLSRWIQTHWTELGWFPLWYGGIPFENTYPPLLHVLVAAVSQLAGMSVARSYHVVTAALYCLGPVAMFWLVWRLSGSRWKALLAGAIFSLLSPSTFLMPSVHADVGSFGASRRIQSLAGYGEGPHVSSMTLALLALVALHAALGERRPGWRTVLAVLAVASVPLTNWHGGVALAGGVLALTFSRSRVQPGRVLIVALLAYALASPWIKPSTIAVYQRNAQDGTRYAMGAPQAVYLIIWLIGFVAAAILLRRSLLTEAARFTLLFLLLMAPQPLLREYTGLYAFPQAERYALELEMALAICAGLLLGRSSKWLVLPAAAGLACLVWLQAPTFRAYTRAHLGPFDVTRTVEYQTARWFQQNLPGRPVFVAGSTQFWLAAFCDNPQLGGGFSQGRINPAVAEVSFSVPQSLANGPQTARLLRAFGIRAVAAGGEKTRDAYRDFKDPGKFSGVLPERWRDGDDAIYEIQGARSESLSHVVRADDLVPGPALDQDAVDRFAGALDNPAYPDASLSWLNTAHVRIETRIRSGDVVSVKVNWHPGWRAEANGRASPLRPDGLGLIVIEPDCAGPCSIDLYYSGGLEAGIARGLCLVAAIVCAIFLIGAAWPSPGKWRSSAA